MPRVPINGLGRKGEMMAGRLEREPDAPIQPPSKKPGPAHRRSKNDPPTIKQLLFIDEYLIDFNATRAARRAGYSPTSSGAVGHALLRKPEIKRRVQIAIEQRRNMIGLSPERIEAEMEALAFGDIRQIFDENGALLAPCDMPEIVAKRISRIKVTTKRIPKKDEPAEVEYVTEIALWDKPAMLVAAARIRGMLLDKLSVDETSEKTITIKGGLPS